MGGFFLSCVRLRGTDELCFAITLSFYARTVMVDQGMMMTRWEAWLRCVWLYMLYVRCTKSKLR